MKDFSKEQIRKILILGHTCFIGRHLMKLLKQRNPEIEIIGKSSRNLDLTRKNQVKMLTNIIDSNTIVIMLSFNAKQSGAGINDFVQNIKMTENLCRFMEKHPPKRFVFFSSQVVYGENTHNTNTTEKTKVDPTSYYGMAKFISERLFWKTFDSLKQCSLLIVRIPRVYGRGANRNDYGPTMFTYNALKKDPITIWGDGLELRDYVFIDDLIDIVDKLLFNTIDGKVNIASGETYSFIDVLKIVESVCKCDVQIEYKQRTRSKVDHVFNIVNLKTLIGDYHFTPLNEGIDAMCQHLKSNEVSNEH